jgi:hypothetical protein
MFLTKIELTLFAALLAIKNKIKNVVKKISKKLKKCLHYKSRRANIMDVPV